MVNCTVEDLSETGERIKDQLVLEFEYKHGDAVWRNLGYTVKMPRPYINNPDEGIYQGGGRYAVKDTHRKWYARPHLTYLLAGDYPNDNYTLGKVNTSPIEKGKTFSFFLDDLVDGGPKTHNGNGRMGWIAYNRLGEQWYLDTRFYIRNNNTKRFLRTISPILRLTYK